MVKLIYWVGDHWLSDTGYLWCEFGSPLIDAYANMASRGYPIPKITWSDIATWNDGRIYVFPPETL